MDWMFQANPKRYDLLAHVAGGIDDNWSMNQHRDRVSVGDTIIFFISGQAAGVRSPDHVNGDDVMHLHLQARSCNASKGARLV